MQLPFDPQRSSAVLSEFDDACHTEMVVHHEASQLIICVDLSTPLSHNPI